MERFLVSPQNLDTDPVSLEGEGFKHLAKVLRLRAGDKVELFDGEGRAILGQIKELERDRAWISRLAPLENKGESPLSICLLQGLPKGEKMEWILQKNTELGVAAFRPLLLQRCVVKLETEKKRDHKLERLEKVVQEASRQCGRQVVPRILPPVGLKEALREIGSADRLLIPWEEGGRPLSESLKEMGPPQSEGRLYILIGPEGGLTQDEVLAAQEQGGQVVTLGPRILRTETAGMAVAAIAQYVWGDMGS